MVIKSPFPDVQIPNVDLCTLIFDRPNAKPECRVPDSKVILIDPIKKREYKFGQVHSLTQQFAQSLQVQLQWKKGDCLAVFSPNCPEYIITVLGTIAAAGVVSPASVGFGIDELTYQLKDCGARALVAHASVLDTALKAAQASGISKQYVFVIEDAPSTTPLPGPASFDSLLSPRVSGSFVRPHINVKEDLAVLPYSSGTTGRPKGVRLSHYNLVSNVLSIWASQSNGDPDASVSNDRFIAILPYSHIYGLSVIVFTSVMGGRTQIILPRFDLIAYLELTQKHHCNTGYIVPPILTALAKHPVIDKYDLSSLREDGLLCAAAPLSASLIDAVYARLKIPVFQAYGMTEASPATHILTLKNWEEGKGSVGPLVPNVEARIVDENGFDIKPGEAGEVWIRGPNIFLGYHNNVAATADCTATDGYYKTGDIAKVDLKTGFFYITDRIKELIKYKAYQVPPAELEGVLSGHPKIADVAVVGAWDAEAHTEVPRGFIVLQPGYQASKELETEICEWLEGRVAHYKRLRGGVRFVSEIPKNPSGKILRRVIKQQVAAEADAAKARL